MPTVCNLADDLIIQNAPPIEVGSPDLLVCRTQGRISPPLYDEVRPRKIDPYAMQYSFPSALPYLPLPPWARIADKYQLSSCRVGGGGGERSSHE